MLLWNTGEGGWNRAGQITLKLVCWVDILGIYDAVVKALIDHMAKTSSKRTTGRSTAAIKEGGVDGEWRESQEGRAFA